MLSFHPLTLEDKPWADRHVFEADSRSADFNFGSMFMWDNKYRQLVCDYGGRLVVLAHAHETPVYPFPVGAGELAPVLAAMREYAGANGFPFVIRGVEKENIPQLEAVCPGGFEFTEDREFEDYIYASDKLATLAGKKLHAKRNFINRFTASHDWSYCRLERQHFPACLKLLEKWDNEESPEYAATVEGEHEAILRGLEHYETLDLVGGALFAEGGMIAFTIGERISSDAFDVHFEKAESDIDGAYPMINKEYVNMVVSLCPEIKYFNREDDMGLDNLRQSKMSYHPDILLQKFTARWNA